MRPPAHLFRVPCGLLVALLLLVGAVAPAGAATRTSKASTTKMASKKSPAKGKGRTKKKRKPTAPRLSPEKLLASLPAVAVEGPEALVPFFDALRGLQEEPGSGGPSPRTVRVLHFGDSHVAADFWTGDLRERLQARFGDAGPGLVMPGRPWRYFRHARARSLAGKGTLRCGLRADPCGGPLGLCRVSLRRGPLSKVPFQPPALDAEFRYAEVLWAVGPQVSSRWTRADSRPFTRALPLSEAPVMNPETLPSPPLGGGPEPPPEPLLAYETEEALGTGWTLTADLLVEGLGEGTHRLEMGPGDGDCLLGVDLRSGEPGVAVDTLGINGSEMVDLEAWEPAVRKALIAHASPALILVSFGTNDMGAKGFDAGTYRETCLRVLEGLRSDAPGASVLVTGPFERGGKSKRTRALMRRRSEAATQALREAALGSGCAFWDARAAMGGEGSIGRWASARLARPDQVHLTEAGYRHISRLLYGALMASYDIPSDPPPGDGAAPSEDPPP